MKATVDIVGGDALQRSLQDYVRLGKKLPEDVLNKKGNDLRIQLYRLFRERRWAGGKNVAHREVRARAAQGRGTLVRSKTLEMSGAPEKTKSRRGAQSVPLTLWQKLVWQESERRQKGIGVLGVSFLMKRWRVKQGARYLARNTSRKLGDLMTMELKSNEQGPTAADGTFTLTGYTPGMRRVSDRYGILQRAKAAIVADMAPYLQRKAAELARKTRL